MILQALVTYYEQLVKQKKVEQEGWCEAKVSYAIELSKEGKILGILSVKKEVSRGEKTVLVPQPMKVPEMVTRTLGISANFLCDNSKFFLGIDKDGTNERLKNCFQAAKEKHLLLLDGVETEPAQAVRAFFETWDPEKAMENETVKEKWDELTEGGNLIFSAGMQYAQEDSQIQNVWEQARTVSAENTQTGICLVTGERTEISRIHKKIKGVPGAQSSGAAFVSFNEPAFCSYGKTQSYNAPVGTHAEFAYTTALNYLLSQREHTFSLGDSMILFWAESGEDTYQTVFSSFVRPKPENQEEIRELFAKLKEGLPVSIDGFMLNPDQKFYILSLAPNAARLSVRFFYSDSFGNLSQNLLAHYERMAMVKPSWEQRDYLGVRDMLEETVNQKLSDKTPVPNMAALTLQAILSGTRYPESLYTNVLIRIRADQGKVTRGKESIVKADRGKVTWGKASIVKAYLIQNKNWKEGVNYMSLNEESMEKAYILGRLFSVLESIQKDAIPNIKSTIRDRYFNSACATPASIFPVLMKLKNSHIKKLERERGGMKIYYEKLLTDLMGRLEEYPKRLSLEDQGKFILGYYHQTQKKYEKKTEDK